MTGGFDYHVVCIFPIMLLCLFLSFALPSWCCHTSVSILRWLAFCCIYSIHCFSNYFFSVYKFMVFFGLFFCHLVSSWKCFHFYPVFDHLSTQVATTSSCQALTTEFSRFTSSLCHICVVLRYLRRILLLPYYLGYSEAFLKPVHLPHHSHISTWRPLCFTGLDLGKRSRKHRSRLFSNSPKLLKIMTVLIHHWDST